MGRPKALLPFEGVPFVERIVAALQSARVEKIVLVLGHNAEGLRQKVDHLPVDIVINGDYKKGQLSSLLCAIRSLENSQDIDGVLVHLVDHPFLNPELVNRMVEGFYDSNKLIVIPRYRGRRGHPVLFSRSLFAELLNTPLDQGAKAVVHAHDADILEIDTDEEGITVDIDTPEEYRQHIRRE